MSYWGKPWNGKLKVRGEPITYRAIAHYPGVPFTEPSPGDKPDKICLLECTPVLSLEDQAAIADLLNRFNEENPQ